jgi:hypothetical protein
MRSAPGHCHDAIRSWGLTMKFTFGLLFALAVTIAWQTSVLSREGHRPGTGHTAEQPAALPPATGPVLSQGAG